MTAVGTPLKPKSPPSSLRHATNPQSQGTECVNCARPDHSAPGKCKLRWLIGLVAAGVVLLPVVIFVWLSRDIAPPKVDDLVLTRIEVPAEEDAYTHFERAAKALAWPEGKMSRDFLEDFGKRVGGSEKVLEDNAEALRHFRRGLACKLCAGPWSWRHDDTLPASGWRNLTLLLTMQAQVCLRDGRRDEAFASCGEAFVFGELLRQRPNSLVMCLVGHVATDTGLQMARMIANDPQVTEAELERLREMIDRVTPPEEGVKHALRAESMRAQNLLNELESGTLAKDKIAPKLARQRLLMSFLFQPNRTRLEMAEWTRKQMRAVRQAMTDPIPGPADVDYAIPKNIVGRYRNAIGRAATSVCLAPASQGRSAHAGLETSISGARLVLALRLFEKRTGKLPFTLEELVPEYLASVPRDPYDGRPFGYDPEGKTAYALGNSRDESGRKRVYPIGSNPPAK